MKSLNPRIIRRRDGSALLTGLSYADLTHILTLASIQQYGSERELREKREPEAAAAIERYRAEGDEMMVSVVCENLTEERIFLRRIRATLDMLKARTSPPWRGEDGPVHALSGFQIKRRLERTRSEKRMRETIREIIRDARDKRAKAFA